MPRLITRCLSEDYLSATDNNSDHDRGELSDGDFNLAIFNSSYAMPLAHDPASPYRPAVGINLAGTHAIRYFYASDYQGSFSLDPTENNEFNADDLNASDEKKFKKVAKIIGGVFALVLLYFAATTLLAT